MWTDSSAGQGSGQSRNGCAQPNGGRRPRRSSPTRGAPTVVPDVVVSQDVNECPTFGRSRLNSLSTPVSSHRPLARALNISRRDDRTRMIRTPFTAESTATEVLTGVDLYGRRALVTGGSSGIGIEISACLGVRWCGRHTGRTRHVCWSARRSRDSERRPRRGYRSRRSTSPG